LKIVHTSDWHAGRIWKGVDRLDELAAVLEHLLGFVERERVELLLHSGDIFDTPTPPAEAERLVFGFFRRLSRLAVPSVVIAGNHDSPTRFEAWGALAELAQVRVLARPRPAQSGGLIEIDARGGQRARVAAVPFAAPRVFTSALQLTEAEGQAHQRYADGLRAMIANVCAPFAADSVNLLMLHTHLEGALFSGSERRVHLGDEWAGTTQALPAAAHYVALGHIHKPQQLLASPAPAYYAGSPLQLDFGEAGEQKGFVVIDAAPRLPARVTRVPYEGGRPLLRVRHTLPELEREAARLRAAGWLHVSVPIVVPDPDLAAHVRRLLPNAVRISPELPEATASAAPATARPGLAPAELYSAYHEREHRRRPEPELLAAFEALRSEAEDAP
jgi:exonuclease SbcD